MEPNQLFDNYIIFPVILQRTTESQPCFIVSCDSPEKFSIFSSLSVSQAYKPLSYRYFHAVLPVLAVIPTDGQPGQYFRIRAGG